MIKNKLIEQVEMPTARVNALVVAERPRGLRICLDPRTLKKTIKRQHFHLPTTEEILAKMAATKYSSTLDVNSGYWQI